MPYPIYEMSTKDIVNFLLIYDAIDFSFWGNPKWTITRDEKQLDSGMALLDCIFALFQNCDSVEVYKRLEKMTLEEFKEFLKGNVEIPLLEERYKNIVEIAKKVNEKMNGTIARIDINDFIWSKGQDKTKSYKPYHLTRTTSY